MPSEAAAAAAKKQRCVAILSKRESARPNQRVKRQKEVGRYLNQKHDWATRCKRRKSPKRARHGQKHKEKEDHKIIACHSKKNLPLLPKMPPVFPGLELAAMSPGKVTPRMVMTI